MSKWKGLRATRSLLRRLPDVAQTEIMGALKRGGERLVAAMRAKARRRTGNLQQGIKFKLYPKTLRMQVGLVGTKRGRAKLFYGFVLDKGRKTQVVTVTRRRVGAPKVLARGRKRAQDVGKPYQMKVRGLQGDRFVTGRYPDLKRTMGEEVRTVIDRAIDQAARGASD